jgi:hypothetical protein
MILSYRVARGWAVFFSMLRVIIEQTQANRAGGYCGVSVSGTLATWSKKATYAANRRYVW